MYVNKQQESQQFNSSELKCILSRKKMSKPTLMTSSYSLLNTTDMYLEVYNDQYNFVRHVYVKHPALTAMAKC